MDKLTLEHLAPYFPYDVRFVNKKSTYYGGSCNDSYTDKRGQLAHTYKRTGKVKGFKDGNLLTTIGFFPIKDTYSTFIDVHVTNKYERKLLLHPLSNYKDVTGPAMNEIDTDIPVQIEISDLAYKQISYHSLSYGAAITCFAYHIDVFGLIDKGLALPIEGLVK